MRIDIIGSIILTLILMLICHIFCLGLFGSIILCILVFAAINYRGRLKGYWNGFKDLFRRQRKPVEVNSSYKYMKIDEED